VLATRIIRSVSKRIDWPRSVPWGKRPPWLASPNARKPAEEPVGQEAASAEEVVKTPPATLPAAVVSTPAAAMAHSQAVAVLTKRWAAGALVRRRGAFVPAAEVRAAFEAFCAGESIDAPNPTVFGKAMTAAGYDRAKIGGVMRYEGVALSASALSHPTARIALDGLSTRRVLGCMATAHWPMQPVYWRG
jgi:hypothetical protein